MKNEYKTQRSLLKSIGLQTTWFYLAILVVLLPGYAYCDDTEIPDLKELREVEFSKTSVPEKWKDNLPAGVAMNLYKRIQERVESKGGNLDEIDLISELRTEYLAGDPWAAAAYGTMLLRDSNEEQVNAAGAIFDEVANKGIALGYLRKAQLLIDGKISPAFAGEAEALLLEASLRGCGEADRLLAEQVRKINPGQGLKILKNGANKGDPKSEYELGLALLNGFWDRDGSFELVDQDREAGEQLLKASFLKGEMGAGAALIYDCVQRNNLKDAESLLSELYIQSISRRDDTWLDYIQDQAEADEFPNEVFIAATNMVSKQAMISERVREAVNLGMPVESVESVDFELVPLLHKRSMHAVDVELKGNAGESVLNLISVPFVTECVGEGRVLAVGQKEVQVDLELYPFFNAKINADAYYLEIQSAESEGYPQPIGPGWAYDGNIPVDQDLRGVLQVGDPIKIRKWRTLYGLFGEYNSLGLKPGIDSTDADEVMLFDASSQKLHTYYYQRDKACWYEKGVGVLKGDVLIYPWEGVLIRRKEEASLFLPIIGEAVEASGLAEVYPGTNLIGNRGNWNRRLALLNLPVEANQLVKDATVVEVVLAEGAWKLVNTDSAWWEVLGLSPDERLNVPEQSGLIVSQPSAGEVLIIDED